ncbi:MAG: histidinol phosphate phosphatase [Campylobacteraceae bacterium 4484_4]|nr:MAG: histidinol phosphate phosphatase [Campylobacteraceae bacterium 4484_4]
MIVDLHNHTTLCNHATGEMEEYLLRAIEKGTMYFGFSEHAPMDFDKGYRMRFDQVPLYEAQIERLQRRYWDRITLLKGYEVDYLEGHIDSRIFELDADYLIGSVHFLQKWGFDNPEFIGEYANRDIDTIWQEYFDAITAMAQSGLFDIVGHLDLIKVFKFLPKKDIRLIAKDAIAAIKEADMVIELNMAGYRKPIEEAYPGDKLMELIAEADIPITFASDAHAPDQVGLFSDKLVALARRFGYDRCAVFRERERALIKF